jgi:hypothetical protein
LHWLKHAFAVDPPGPAEPTPEQREVVDAACRELARRHLTTPGLIALEMGRPLNFITSQLMHAVSPAVWALTGQRKHEQYRQLSAFLEKRGSFDYICSRVEHFEKEFERRERKKGKPGAEAPDERGGT